MQCLFQSNISKFSLLVHTDTLCLPPEKLFHGLELVEPSF